MGEGKARSRGYLITGDKATVVEGTADFSTKKAKKRLKSLRWWDPVPAHMRPDRLALTPIERFGYWFLRRILRVPWHSIIAMGMLADMELTAEALYRAKVPISATMPQKIEGDSVRFD